MTAVLAFRAGERSLCADIGEILAVEPRPPLTRAPRAPPALAGVGALRGKATAVFELAALLGDERSKGSRLLLLRGEPPAALAVDHVEGLRPERPAASDFLDLRAVVAQAMPAPPRSSALHAAEPARPKAAGQADLAFVAFSLCGQRFAFPVEEVRAVAPAPGALFSVPQADPIVLGLAEHGGDAIPVVDLADLLGLPHGVARHMLVVTLAGAAVGLRVERLLGVLRIKSGAVAPAPALLNRGAGEARVAALARGPSGLTAILSARRLFDAETTRRLDALARPAPARSARAAPVAHETFLVFRVGGDRYALPAAAVQAVARRPKALKAPPQAPPFVAGIVSRGGETVPILDLARCFGAEPGGGGSVVFTRGGATTAGWLVDEVTSLAQISRERMTDAPPLGGEAGAFFAAAAVHDGGPLLVIDAEAALRRMKADLSAWTTPRRA